MLAEAVQAATEQHMVLDFVDQDDTGDDAMAVAAEHGIRLDVINVLEAKRGFVLLPRRWVVERSIAMKQVLVKASKEVVIQR